MRSLSLTPVALLLSLAGCSPAEDTARKPSEPAVDRAASESTAAEGTSGMVASAHPMATEAGLGILRAGGNAFDAAVAIAATLNVVEPMMSGIGGYGTIMVFDAGEGSPMYLDASGKIPVGVDPDAYRAPTPNYLENRVGAKAVSTPGAVHAWEAMHEHGSLPWADLLQPAIRAAEDGYVLDERIAGFVGMDFDEFSDYSKSIYGRDGEPLGVGDRLVQTDLANTLRILAREGAAAIYGGELGEAIDESMRSAGGFLAMEDLENHVAEWWQPLHLAYRGHDIYTPSAPAGAFPMLIRLGMMDRMNARELGHNSLEYLHSFAEVTKLAYWDRLAYSGDPDVKPPPYDRLLSGDYCTFEPAGNPMDAHPGRRKLSSDAPALIFRDGKPVVAIGTPGGHTITQTIAQMILNMLDFGMDIEEAIAAPRIAFIEPNTLAVEETIPADIRDQLARRGHEIEIRYLGNANGLSIEYLDDGSMRFTGASDPRGAGLAKGL